MHAVSVCSRPLSVGEDCSARGIPPRPPIGVFVGLSTSGAIATCPTAVVCIDGCELQAVVLPETACLRCRVSITYITHFHCVVACRVQNRKLVVVLEQVGVVEYGPGRKKGCPGSCCPKCRTAPGSFPVMWSSGEDSPIRPSNYYLHRCRNPAGTRPRSGSRRDSRPFVFALPSTRVLVVGRP